MNTEAVPPGTAETESIGAPVQRPRFPFVILYCFGLLVVLTATLVTFILPETYASTARIKIEHDQSDIPGINEPGVVQSYDPYFVQTEFEVIKSAVVLTNAIDKLDLRSEWGKKFGSAGPLKTPECINILKSRLDLEPVRNTSIVRITVFSDRSNEAARLANSVAEAYRNHRLQQRRERFRAGIMALEQALSDNDAQIQSVKTEIATLSRESTQQASRLSTAQKKLEDLERLGNSISTRMGAAQTDARLPATSMVEIVDTAVPMDHAVRPNKPLNIALGIFIGLVVGLFLATLVYLLQLRAYWRATRPQSHFSRPLRTIIHMVIALIVGTIVGYHCATPLDYGTIIVVPLSVIIGAAVSAYLELAQPHAIPAPANQRVY